MSVNTVHIKVKINFTVILFAVLLVHLFLLVSHNLPNVPKLAKPEERQPLVIRDIRTVGAKDSKIKSAAYLSKSELDSNKVSPKKAGTVKAPPTARPALEKRPLSLSDLSVAKKETSDQLEKRPGSRPEVLPENPKALSAISLKGKQISEFAKQSSPSGASASKAVSASHLSGDPRTRSLNNSDILVNLEVPEGVNPDELNKFELMFYGFQRRTAINYVNAFYKNLDKFQRENPHMQFPMTETKQIMTGRLTYDEKGNVKQIKMIRWTNVDRLQTFFEDVLKDMDTLHNPPKPLWSKTGEFSIFFSLVING